MDVSGVATSVAYILGGLAVLGGIGHWIGVTGLARHEKRGYDVRLADMLAIGFLPLGAGVLMLVGARTDSAIGPALLAWTATGFTLILAILWPVLSRPPEGNKTGAAVVIAVYAAEAVLAWLAV